MKTTYEKIREIRNKAFPPELEEGKYKKIELTNGVFSLVSASMYDELRGFSWSMNEKGYACRMDNKKVIFLHRFTLSFKLPTGWYIDHINGDRLDNRLENLRAVTMSQNHMNKGSFSGVSKYKGVYFKKDFKRKKPWCSTIKIDSCVQYIGLYKTEVEAAKAYDERANFFFGDRAKLNFGGKPVSLNDIIRLIIRKDLHIAFNVSHSEKKEWAIVIAEDDVWIDISKSIQNQLPQTLKAVYQLIR